MVVTSAAAPVQEADERQKRFMALNGGWRKKEAALDARAAASERTAATAADTAAAATVRAESAVQVRFSGSFCSFTL